MSAAGLLALKNAKRRRSAYEASQGGPPSKEGLRVKFQLEEQPAKQRRSFVPPTFRPVTKPCLVDPVEVAAGRHQLWLIQVPLSLSKSLAGAGSIDIDLGALNCGPTSSSMNPVATFTTEDGALCKLLPESGSLANQLAAVCPVGSEQGEAEPVCIARRLTLVKGVSQTEAIAATGEAEDCTAALARLDAALAAMGPAPLEAEAMDVDVTDVALEAADRVQESREHLDKTKEKKPEKDKKEKSKSKKVDMLKTPGVVLTAPMAVVKEAPATAPPAMRPLVAAGAAGERPADAGAGDGMAGFQREVNDGKVKDQDKREKEKNEKHKDKERKDKKHKDKKHKDKEHKDKKHKDKKHKDKKQRDDSSGGHEDKTPAAASVAAAVVVKEAPLTAPLPSRLLTAAETPANVVSTGELKGEREDKRKKEDKKRKKDKKDKKDKTKKDKAILGSDSD